MKKTAILSFSSLFVALLLFSSAYAQSNVPAVSAPSTPPVLEPEKKSSSPGDEKTTKPTEASSDTPDADTPTPIEKEINEQVSFQRPSPDVSLMSSLFFSIWEHDLIADARKGLKTRLPGTEDGIPSGVREISLGGIVFHSSKNWTIWLNNARVSANSLPEEVMDLKVYKGYIDLEWFDASTNQIFPIRLRTHQRFNLDARLFLPE